MWVADDSLSDRLQSKAKLTLEVAVQLTRQAEKRKQNRNVVRGHITKSDDINCQMSIKALILGENTTLITLIPMATGTPKNTRRKEKSVTGAAMSDMNVNTVLLS